MLGHELRFLGEQPIDNRRATARTAALAPIAECSSVLVYHRQGPGANGLGWALPVWVLSAALVKTFNQHDQDISSDSQSVGRYF
jgi:hypothetical protein